MDTNSLQLIVDPDMTTMRKLARITFQSRRFLEVFWDPDTRNVILHNASSWYSIKDENIFTTLCRFLTGPPKVHHLVADRLMVFDQSEDPANVRIYDDMPFTIYECEWSDFSCDDLVLHCNFTRNGLLLGDAERRQLSVDCTRLSSWQMATKCL